MPIDRCVCFDVKFSVLKSYATENASNISELQAQFGCGRRCSLCLPYIQMMLRTGAVEFNADEPLAPLD